MELSELAAYAEEKYHMAEERKWAEFPGFSVLADPETKKWVALLMRQWDYETGTELQRCDIKCGKQIMRETDPSYVTNAFRMKGDKWVGVIFDSRTDPHVVRRLFDKAVETGRQGGHTIVLESLRGNYSIPENRKKGDARTDTVRNRTYHDTAIPPRDSVRREPRLSKAPQRGTQRSSAPGGGAIDLELPQNRAAQNNAAGRPQSGFIRPDKNIPPRILEMMQLYEYGSSSFENKCRNFYRQGRFMEDYEDDAPWNGEYRRYFTTYHDLNLNLLRGYFAWRAHVRSGDFNPIATSLAYMYVYELLNGIGTESDEDALRKMKEFETGYLDSGVGDPGMRENLHRWMLDYAVLHGAPVEQVIPFLDPALLERDKWLLILRSPAGHSDEEVFNAICALTDGKIAKSPVYTGDPARGMHLYAEVWRYMAENCRVDDRDLFTACFGRSKSYPWHPLANAVYYEREDRRNTEYVINDCRKFVCRSGGWFEERYDNLFFDKYRIHAVMHEADRQLRKYLKTGRYLREKQGEEWIRPYVEAVIAAEQAAAEEAARPKITIDLSGLDKIRLDAQITRDSLLTEDEMQEQAADGGMPVFAAEMPSEGAAEVYTAYTAAADANASEPEYGAVSAAQTAVHTKVQPAVYTEEEPSDRDTAPAAIEIASLDDVHVKILVSVMKGEPVQELIRSARLMVSVVTDRINEALFDEIGDNVLECDGDGITLVEDYREDVAFILGGDI